MSNEKDKKLKIVGMTADKIAGDLLGALILEMKQLKDPWQKVPEHKQREVIDRIRKRVIDNVNTAVNLIAAAGRNEIVCDLVSMSYKGNVSGVLKFGAKDPKRLDLADSIGKSCILIVTDTEQFIGGTDQVKPEPNQKDLLEKQTLEKSEKLIKKAAKDSKFNK